MYSFEFCQFKWFDELSIFVRRTVGDLFRMVASEDNTDISFPGLLKKNMSAGEYIQLIPKREEASKMFSTK